jgi:Fe-S-cluster formation regulator IscX/YfhJ
MDPRIATALKYLFTKAHIEILAIEPEDDDQKLSKERGLDAFEAAIVAVEENEDEDA